MSPHLFHVIRMRSVRSTQEEARRLLSGGCRPGTILLAGEQTAGRGRGDRSWHSSNGLGIWMTLVHRSVRPASEWPALTSAAGLAICRTMEDLSLQPAIKWPNDILLPGGKVAGVLAETVDDAVLLGIGINVLHEVDGFPVELRETATSVRIEQARTGGAEPLEINEVFDCLLSHLDDVLRTNEHDGPAGWLQHVWERSIVRDRQVGIRRGAGDEIAGLAIGLGPIGELMLETESGTVGVANGTITHLEDR